MVMYVSTAGMVGRGRVADPLGVTGNSLAGIYGYANSPSLGERAATAADEVKRRAIKAEKERNRRKARKEKHGG